MSIKFSCENSGISDFSGIKDEVLDSYKTLTEKTGLGNEFLDWIKLPEDYDKEEFKRIKDSAKRIKENSDVLVAIGIGGSYLGAEAVIKSLTGKVNKPDVEVIFAGNNLSPIELTEVLEYIKDKDFSINVISKSGTTMEPSIAFRVLKDEIEKRYGKEGSIERIYVTTDKKKGALKPLADEIGYETFVVPDGIGGRYSVLTAVGLLPIAAAGLDIDLLLKGARNAMDKYNNDNFDKNDALKYAAIRNLLYRDGKKIEIFASYEPKMRMITEWLKQLFGESEGKDGVGIFPAGAIFTTDLHSFGQMIQEGERNLFETVINIENPNANIVIKEDEVNADGLNYLTGKTLDYINKMAMQGTIEAHVDGGVPNLMVTLDKLDEENIGELLYFFEFTCGVSGYTLGVNPFNQPGVEAYKSNMFRLLGRP